MSKPKTYRVTNTAKDGTILSVIECVVENGEVKVVSQKQCVPPERAAAHKACCIALLEKNYHA